MNTRIIPEFIRISKRTKMVKTRNSENLDYKQSEDNRQTNKQNTTNRYYTTNNRIVEKNNMIIDFINDTKPSSFRSLNYKTDLLMKTASLHNADLILVHILPGQHYLHLEQTINHRFEDDSVIEVRAIHYNSLKVTGLYIERNSNIDKLKGRALQCISRLFADRGTIGFMNHSLTTLYEVMGINKYRIEIKDRNKMVAWFSELLAVGHEQTEFKHQQISLGHIRFVTWGELKKTGLTHWLQHALPIIALLYNNRSSDWNEAFSVGLLLWYSVLPKYLKVLLENSNFLEPKRISINDWHSMIKKKTMVFKALQNTIEEDLTPLFEIEVLVNRGVGEVNWQDELDHRVTPNLAKPGRDKVFEICETLFKKSKMLGLKPFNQNFREFWNTRWEWATSGAYHSQYAEDELPQNTHRLLKNKMFGLCSMTDKSFDKWINRSPSIYAWSSIKYEWGKQRAIYGCDLTSYIISSFAMKGCENVLDSRFPIGERSNEKNVHAGVKAILRDRTSCCIDFEDFNSQHSNSSMQAVLEAYMSVFGGDMSEEQYVALAWTIKSIDHTYIKLPRTEFKRIEGTLMTGWRLTTFMNTVLNYVYKEIAQPTNLSALHNGDDIILGVKKFDEVLDLIKGFKKINARLQLSKCYTGSIAEFLRVDHKRGGGGQYLARAIATYVHGKTESVVPNKFRDIAEAVLVRRQEILDRQADQAIFDKMHESVLDYIESRWFVEKGIIRKMAITHRSAGGFSNQQDSKIDMRFEDVQTFYGEIEGTENIIINKRLPGVVDLFQVYKRRLEVDKLPVGILDGFTKVVYDAVSRVRSTVKEILPLDIMTAAPLKSSYKRFSDTANSARVRLCIFYGVPLVSKKLTGSKLAVHVAQYAQPYKWLSILA